MKRIEFETHIKNFACEASYGDGVSIIWGAKNGGNWADDAVELVFPREFSVEYFLDLLYHIDDVTEWVNYDEEEDGE